MADYRVGTFSLAVLLGLQNQQHIYAGTVPAATVANRRERNKLARAARRLNRG